MRADTHSASRARVFFFRPNNSGVLLAGAIAAFIALLLSPLQPGQLIAPAVAQDATQANMCSNTCRWANDGECDDGGVGAKYRVCGFGTDCNDCGARNESQRRGLQPRPGLPFGASASATLAIRLASATHDRPVQLHGNRGRLANHASGRQIRLEGRWVGLIRQTFLGQYTGLDVRFGGSQMRVSPALESTSGLIDGGTQRYDLWVDPLLRVDRPFGRGFGLGLSIGPTLRLSGLGAMAELSVRLTFAERVTVEPHIGIALATSISRELRTGVNAYVRVSEKIAVTLQYLLRLGELPQNGEHRFTQHGVALGVAF